MVSPPTLPPPRDLKKFSYKFEHHSRNRGPCYSQVSSSPPHPLQQHPLETLAHTYQGEANKAALFFQITQIRTSQTKPYYQNFLFFFKMHKKYDIASHVCISYSKDSKELFVFHIHCNALENNIQVFVTTFLKTNRDATRKALNHSFNHENCVFGVGGKSLAVKPKVDMKSSNKNAP